MESQSNNEIKAAAVKDFVNMMIGARDSGFVDSSAPTLAEIHRVAQSHIKDCYGVVSQSLSEEWGDGVYRLCKQGLEVFPLMAQRDHEGGELIGVFSSQAKGDAAIRSAKKDNLNYDNYEVRAIVVDSNARIDWY